MRVLPRGLLLVCLVAAIVAAPNLFGDFVLDDKEAILKSGCVTGELAWSELFVRNFWCQEPGQGTVDAWRPWPVIWWRLGWAVGGGASFPFHMLSLLLHAACACALVLAAVALGVGERFSVLLGMLFAASPIHVDAIGWAVGQADLWAAGLGLSSVWLLRRGRNGASMACFAVALCCKESVLMLLPALWLLETSGDTPPRAARQRRLALTLIAAVYLLGRTQALGELGAAHNTFTGNPLMLESWVGRLPYAPSLWGRYALTTLVGGPLSADWSHDALGIRTGVDPLYSVAGAIVVGLAGWVAFRYWDDPALRWACLVLAAYGLLLGQMLTPLPVTYAERLFYLPSAALLLICVRLAELHLAAAAPSRRRIAATAAGLLLVVHTGLAMRMAHAWTTEPRIIAATLESAPDSGRARVWAAWVAAEAEDAAAVKEHSAVAIELQPYWPLPHALQAFALDRLGQPELAAQSCGRAMSLDPSAALATSLCVQFLIGRGKLDAARQVYAEHAAARGGYPAPEVPVP